MPYRGTLWVGVLKSLSAYQMYRQAVRRNVQPEAVLPFLLRSRTFPRAVAHTLQEIASGIGTLPRNTQALRAVREAEELLNSTDMTQLRGAALHEFIDLMQLRLERVHETIYTTWFAPELET